jgi:hypothetical protein
VSSKTTAVAVKYVPLIFNRKIIDLYNIIFSRQMRGSNYCREKELRIEHTEKAGKYS